jgi:hypothetical protein
MRLLAIISYGTEESFVERNKNEATKERQSKLTEKQLQRI